MAIASRDVGRLLHDGPGWTEEDHARWRDQVLTLVVAARHPRAAKRTSSEQVLAACLDEAGMADFGGAV